MLRVRRRKVWKSMITLGLVAAAAAILVLSAGAVSAKGKPPKPPKPPQEEPQDPNPDTGIIYFEHEYSVWSMLSDGTGKTNLGLTHGETVDPSESTRSGERWFLTVGVVAGTYPNGTDRYEIFAVSESGTRVQLTDAADVAAAQADQTVPVGWMEGWIVMNCHPRWADGDTKVTYYAHRWVDGATVDDGLYEVSVNWAEPQAPARLPVGDVYGSPYDWSPDGSQLVYDEGGSVYVVSAAGGAPSQITSGHRPDWSPDGARILVHDGDDVYSVTPSGGDRTLVVSRSDSKKEDLHYPTWSPNATHVAYSVRKNRGQLPANVYRANAQGEYETNLTEDLVSNDTQAFVIAWRAE